MMGNLLQARNKGLYSSGTFLDLSKAFDTLNHDVLIKKMESYGMRGLTSDWFRSYLSNCFSVAKVKTNPSTVTYSEPYHITYGTAQGSCLGPLFFILFCNDIKLLPLYGKLILFLDDTTLLNTHCNKNFVQYSIVHDLDILMNWFKVNQLSLNLSKTVVLNFWENKDGGFITIDGREIPLVNNTKFIGVHLNSRLTWSTHIDHVHKNLMTNKMLLKSSCNMLTTNCLKSVYYAHVYSHLTYGLISWGPMIMKSAINELSRIQDACIQIACKQSKWASMKPLYNRLQTLRLPELIMLDLAKYG